MAEGGWPKPVVTGHLPYKEGSSTSNLSFLDCVPDNYENFSALIAMANAWLKRNPSRKVITCELRDVIKGSNGIDPVKSGYGLFKSFSSNKRHFFRCLRLWLTDNDSPEHQEIHCMLKAPDLGHSDTTSFTDIIQQVNAALQRSPLQGKIINVQTQPYKVSSGGTLDVSRTDWHITNEVKYRYLNVMHIFYQSGLPAMEYIGFADFTPNRLSKGVMGLGDFEEMSVVVEKARRWIAATSDIHVCNIESLNCKLKKHIGGEHLDTTRSLYTEDLNDSTYYARYVRVMYTKSATVPPPASPLHIYHKDFDIFADSGQSYSSQKDLLVLINQWLRSSGSRVISAETIPVSIAKNPEDTYRNTSQGKRYRFVMRVFAMKR